MGDPTRSMRDRDEAGRPRNARPRDALGRPLPRDAANAFEEGLVAGSPEEALQLGIAHFNARRFFQAHEVWEEAWHPSPEPERAFWQGIIQVAVGFTHFQRGNVHGAVTLLRRGAERLAPYGDRYKDLPVGTLATAAERAAAAIERDGVTATVEFPTID